MKYWLTHPDNVSEMRRLSTFAGFENVPFFAMPVRTSSFMPRYASKWEPPKERFFDYDKSDEVWLKYFGFGGYKQTNEPLILLIDEPEFRFTPLFANMVVST